MRAALNVHTCLGVCVHSMTKRNLEDDDISELASVTNQEEICTDNVVAVT